MKAQLEVLEPPEEGDSLNIIDDLFHRVNRVLPENQKLLTITPETLVRDAITLMTKYGYSQLPVVMENGRVQGVFSHRSFASKAALETLDFFQRDKVAPGDLPVEEYLEKFHYTQVTDELHSVFAAIEKDNGILVGTSDNLIGVLSPMDFLSYLFDLASPFVMLSEIELSLRKLISSAVDASQFSECVGKSLSQIYKDRTLPTSVEAMTFEDYRTITNHGDNWAHFQKVLGGTRNRFATKLETIRDLRNDVFHFKRAITFEDREELQSLRDWFLRKAEQLEPATTMEGDQS